MPGLNEVVVFYNEVETENEYGTLVQAEVTVARVFAKVRAMSGRERDRGQQTEARSNYLVTCWRRSDITEKTRIRWRSKEGNIRFIPDSGPTKELIDIEVEFGAP